MLKRYFAIALCLCLILGTTACGDGGQSLSVISSEQSTVSEIASQTPQGVSFLSSMNELEKIDYASLFLDISLSGREDNNAVACGDKELCRRFENVLSACLLSEEQPPVPAGESEPPSPAGGCVTFVLTDYTDPDHSVVYIASVYDTGKVYYINTDGSEWMKAVLADHEQYPVLHSAVEELKAEAQRLPYSLSAVASPESFLPESTVLRLRIFNDGARTAEGKLPFTIEKKDGESWKELAKVNPASGGECIAVPREYMLYAFDLTAIPGGQEEGSYRILASFSDGVDTVDLSVEYEINVGAGEISYPPPPEMTPENKEYCDKYVASWGFYSPFDKDFSEDNYLKEFRTYLLYYTVAYSQGKSEEYDSKFGEWIPADIFEGTIQRRFLLSSEAIRRATGTNPNGGEYYDAAKNAYYMPGGYGGGSLTGVVMDSKRDGDLLTLSVNWYGMDDGFVYAHDLTIRVDNAEEFHYIANKVTSNPDVGSPAATFGGGF